MTATISLVVSPKGPRDGASTVTITRQNESEIRATVKNGDESSAIFAPITVFAILRSVHSQGFSRCGGTFAPLHKDGTVRCVQRKLKKLGWQISPTMTSWAYDVLGAMNGTVLPDHGYAN